MNETIGGRERGVVVNSTEALQILRENSIPYYPGVGGMQALLRRTEADLILLRRLGFRISHDIGRQMVLSYKGSRIGLIT